MRTILSFAVIILFLLFGYILLGIFWIYGKINKEAADFCQLRIVQFIFKCVHKTAGIHLTVIGEFKDGSFKIASKTGCKIVPVAITGTNRIFEDHVPFIKSADVIIKYGEPILFSDLDKEDQKHVGAYFQNLIHEMLLKHKEMM